MVGGGGTGSGTVTPENGRCAEALLWGAHRALCLRRGKILDPFSLMAKVTAVSTVFPYTGLLRFLLSPKTQITS